MDKKGEIKELQKPYTLRYHRLKKSVRKAIKALKLEKGGEIMPVHTPAERRKNRKNSRKKGKKIIVKRKK